MALSGHSNGFRGTANFLRRALLLPLEALLCLIVALRCELVPKRAPENPLLTATPDELRVRRNGDGTVMMCRTCGGSGFSPMPWHWIPGLRGMKFGYPPSRWCPSGWGYCPDCRYGVSVDLELSPTGVEG